MPIVVADVAEGIFPDDESCTVTYNRLSKTVIYVDYSF
jgi:hypothetical protein